MAADGLAECSGLIRSMNADAPIVRTQHSSVKIASLLNQRIYTQDAASAASSHTVPGLSLPSKRYKADRSASASKAPESNRPAIDQSVDASHSSSSTSISAQNANKSQQGSGEHNHTSRVSTMAIRPSGPVALQRCVNTHASTVWQRCILHACRPRGRTPSGILHHVQAAAVA